MLNVFTCYWLNGNLVILLSLNVCCEDLSLLMTMIRNFKSVDVCKMHVPRFNPSIQNLVFVAYTDV